jgi:hypothetical protein
MPCLYPPSSFMAEPDLDTALRYLDQTGGWASCLSQEGVDWLSHVRRPHLMRRGASAHDLVLQIVLSTHPSHVAYARGVRRLRRLCRQSDLVPTSCTVPLAVFADSATPFSRTTFSDVWSAMLEGQRVAMKALRLYGDQVYDVRRVSGRNSLL